MSLFELFSSCNSSPNKETQQPRIRFTLEQL